MSWAAAGAAAVGIGASFLSGKQQQLSTKKFYRHRYQWQREDLEKAGYSPMLPFLGGSGSGAPGVPSQAQMQVPDFQKGVTNALAAQRIETELSEIRSREQLNQYLGRKAQADASHSASQKTLTDVQTLMQLYDMPRAMNASAIESEYGPAKQKTEWIFQRLGDLIPGLIFGVGRFGRGGGKAARAPGGARPKQAPYVGPRNRRRTDAAKGSRPWRASDSKAPGQKNQKTTPKNRGYNY